jgi:hypothetical protein
MGFMQKPSFYWQVLFDEELACRKKWGSYDWKTGRWYSAFGKQEETLVWCWGREKNYHRSLSVKQPMYAMLIADNPYIKQKRINAGWNAITCNAIRKPWQGEQRKREYKSKPWIGILGEYGTEELKSASTEPRI